MEKELKDTEKNKSYTKDNIKIRVTQHRDRNGCDICDKDVPTEAFIGFRGNVLWICGKCFKKTTQEKKK